MPETPRWLMGREPWLAGAISVVLVAGVVGAAVTDRPFKPLTEERVEGCALDAASDLLAEPTVLQVVRIEATSDDTSWTATVSGNDSLLLLTYREGDGVVTDATLVDRGGGAELDAVARSRLLDETCD